MNKIYKHTQIGYLIIIALSAMILFITYLSIFVNFDWVAFIVLALLIICLILFSTLTVIIDEENLEIKLGQGIIRKKFLLKDIESCLTVKNPWYYGWGIHCTPNGWLYNVSGFDAIEIKMNNCKKYRIGTDEPNELEKKIRESLEKIR